MILIPAYQEAATIGDVVARCQAAAPGSMVLVVDDGSDDGSGAIAAAGGARVLCHARNLGKGASLAHGMRHALAAGADCIVTLDGDGQHRPEDIPRLIAHAARWPDRIIVGSRRAGRVAAPRGRRACNRLADFWVSLAAGAPIEDSQSGFRVYPAAVLRALPLPETPGFAWESEVLIAAGRRGVRTAAIDIPTLYGAVLRRPSHFRPVRDITRIVLMVGRRILSRKR